MSNYSMIFSLQEQHGEDKFTSPVSRLGDTWTGHLEPRIQCRNWGIDPHRLHAPWVRVQLEDSGPGERISYFGITVAISDERIEVTLNSHLPW